MFRQRTALIEHGIEGATFQIIHDYECITLGADPEVIDADDVLMGKTAGGACLSLKAFDAVAVIHKMPVQELYCHHTLNILVLGSIDHTHTASPYRFDNLITIGKYLPYQLVLFNRDQFGIVERAMRLVSIEGPVAFKTTEGGFLAHDNFQR